MPDSFDATAHRTPWSVSWVYDTHPLVTNAGSRPLDFVRASVAETGCPGQLHHWGQMLPGETAELCLCAHDPDCTVVTLSWYCPDDARHAQWRLAL